MVWDVKALPDRYELVREDTGELLLGFFSQRLALDLNLGIFSVWPQKTNKQTKRNNNNKKSQLFTHLGNNSIWICLFQVISLAMMCLNYILNRTCSSANEKVVVFVRLLVCSLRPEVSLIKIFP